MLVLRRLRAWRSYEGQVRKVAAGVWTRKMRGRGIKADYQEPRSSKMSRMCKQWGSEKLRHTRNAMKRRSGRQ